MGALANRTKPSMFDLQILEFDELPAFVIRVSVAALEFELLYSNEAFRKGSFREIILADYREALLFRSWAQALGQPVDSQHACAGRTWAGEMAAKSGAFKIIKATHEVSREGTSNERLQDRAERKSSFSRESRLFSRSTGLASTPATDELDCTLGGDSDHVGDERRRCI